MIDCLFYQQYHFEYVFVMEKNGTQNVVRNDEVVFVAGRA